MLKRTSVEVCEVLLEHALKVTGEQSPGAVVDKALEELVRIAELKRGIAALRDTSDVFWDNYLEEIRPNCYSAYEKRRAAYEGRLPERVVNGRRSD